VQPRLRRGPVGSGGWGAFPTRGGWVPADQSAVCKRVERVGHGPPSPAMVSLRCPTGGLETGWCWWKAGMPPTQASGCPQGRRGLRVEAEVEVEHVERVSVFVDPVRVEHGRRPPVLGSAEGCAGSWVSQTGHVVAPGARTGGVRGRDRRGPRRPGWGGHARASGRAHGSAAGPFRHPASAPQDCGGRPVRAQRSPRSIVPGAPRIPGWRAGSLPGSSVRAKTRLRLGSPGRLRQAVRLSCGGFHGALARDSFTSPGFPTEPLWWLQQVARGTFQRRRAFPARAVTPRRRSKGVGPPPVWIPVIHVGAGRRRG